MNFSFGFLYIEKKMLFLLFLITSFVLCLVLFLKKLTNPSVVKN